MGMDPRLLRPRETGGFTPRSISGLALWLDAADSSTLYTTDAGPVTAVSSPLDIAGCVGWWDASDASSITQSGGLVSQWNDKSGNGRHLSQATSANRPSCTTRTLNGRAVLEFDGSNDLLSLADGSGNPTYGIDIATSRAVTIIAVFASDVTNSIRDLLSLQRTGKNSNDTGVYVRRHTNLSGSVEFAAGAGNSTTNDQTDKNNIRGFANTSTDAMMVSFAVSASAGVYAAHMNGAGQSLTLRFGTLPATGFLQEGTGGHTLDIGASRNFGNSLSTSVWDGIVAEVVMFNAALSTADRARVEAYLAAKWGISGVHAQATATNDPVGAWLDKSGNGRHATQATGTSRPARGAAAASGRAALSFDGSSDWMTLGVQAIGGSDLGFSSGSPFTFAAVHRPNAGANTHLFAKASGTSANRTFAIETRGLTANYGFRLRGSTTGLQANGMVTGDNDIVLFTWTGTAASYLSRNIPTTSLSVGTAAVESEDITIGIRTASAPSGFFAGTVSEILFYNKALTSGEQRRLTEYLASKWGITLAPQVSNADAQDWINRVYANGGTVSATTANAVNKFCVDIENAGIRDRFYRLNLFCGNSDASLNAVRTPLYRGPSLGGTQYGNTIDTNAGNLFVANDYAENNGLIGNGASKYLDTGLAANAVPLGNRHLAVYEKTKATGQYLVSIGARTNATPAYWELETIAPATSYTAYAGDTVNNVTATGYSGGAMWLSNHSPTSTLSLYKNGQPAGTTTSITATTSIANNIYVFALNVNNSASYRTDARLAGYSIGLALSSAGDVAAYYNAMQAFQTAMGRQV